MNLQDDQITPYPVIQTTTYTCITQYVGHWSNIDRSDTQYAKALYSNTIFETLTSQPTNVTCEDCNAYSTNIVVNLHHINTTEFLTTSEVKLYSKLKIMNVLNKKH